MPATPKLTEKGIPGADVLIDLKGPTAALRSKTAWRWQKLTSKKKSDREGSTYIIPLGLFGQDRSHHDDDQ